MELSQGFNSIVFSQIGIINTPSAHPSSVHLKSQFIEWQNSFTSSECSCLTCNTPACPSRSQTQNLNCQSCPSEHSDMVTIYILIVHYIFRHGGQLHLHFHKFIIKQARFWSLATLDNQTVKNASCGLDCNRLKMSHFQQLLMTDVPSRILRSFPGLIQRSHCTRLLGGKPSDLERTLRQNPRFEKYLDLMQ